MPILKQGVLGPIVASLLVTRALVAQCQQGDPTGYFERTAISKQAGRWKSHSTCVVPLTKRVLAAKGFHSPDLNGISQSGIWTCLPVPSVAYDYLVDCNT